MESKTSFLAGFAASDFTPEPGLPLLGQMKQRLATGARDPLLCNSVALRQGEATVVIVAVDVILLALPEVESLQAQWAERTGLPPGSLLIHATHTHDAPATYGELMEEVDPAFLESLLPKILESALKALDKLEPVELFAGTGHMEQMGWNRRAMLEDGTSAMYSSSETPGFIGMEGPRDPALPVLFARNAAGKITGILLSFATHPNSIESALTYSADVPGEVRKNLKKLFGEEVGVVYLTAACGNTAPSILDPYDESHPWRYEEGLTRSGLFMAGEAAKVIASTLHPMTEPVLEVQRVELSLPIRATWPQPGEPTFPQSPDNPYYERSERNWPEYVRANSPVATRINGVRIGDAVICTNPAELFVEFGLQIRAASPARVTFISELTDGYIGYVPTELAFSRGGYETWCAPSSQLQESAGQQITDTTIELLRKLFPG